MGAAACKWADMQVKIICLVLSQDSPVGAPALLAPGVVAQTCISTAGIDFGLEINGDVIIWFKIRLCGVRKKKGSLEDRGVFGVY